LPKRLAKEFRRAICECLVVGERVSKLQRRPMSRRRPSSVIAWLEEDVVVRACAGKADQSQEIHTGSFAIPHHPSIRKRSAIVDITANAKSGVS
jgi:hypothetical protein